MRRLLAMLLFLLLPVLPAGAEPTQLCRAAIARAEAAAGIPAGLLQAIGRVESGRRDPQTGQFGPWPWTINAEGRGHFLPSREAALALVREMQARGVRSMDVGCMQVNLLHHPRAFPSLEEAFDPDANARYAARFLSELQSTRADWMLAAAHYHSQTPHFAEAYRARVQAAWAQTAPQAAQDRALAQAPPPAAPRVLANGADRVQVAMAATPGAGRGLDAYRAQPVPLAARTLLPAFRR
ncbi:lytic transglycosylase domain-containing protein [Roseococcus sp. DSY-14]|uniref:lytic transglycosylase domain-containing protein n=1 Tax=Roseococcus sp. DSY-14 TaxID=3369650 RepID=UPI00387AE377